MREVLPTRSAVLELADERKLMRQGYEFLDEKRMLLAGEMLRQLADDQRLEAQRSVALREAGIALAAAIERHGFDDLQAFPGAAAVDVPPPDRSLFLGLAMLRAREQPAPGASTAQAVDPSPEARACQAAFERVVWLSHDLGLRAGNLLRLMREYRRTERRARTLEKVLLPEVDGALQRVSEQLDTMEREELVRTRWSRQGV